MTENFEICENETTNLLERRFVAAYYVFDDARVQRAESAFDRNIRSMRDEAIEKKLLERGEPYTAENITKAYNEFIAEETERLIASALRDGVYPRAQAEFDIAEAMAVQFQPFV